MDNLIAQLEARLAESEEEHAERIASQRYTIKTLTAANELMSKAKAELTDKLVAAETRYQELYEITHEEMARMSKELALCEERQSSAHQQCIDNAAQIEDLQSAPLAEQLFKVQRELAVAQKRAAYFKCCALSGETPKDEP